jgi:hypothetical protein
MLESNSSPLPGSKIADDTARADAEFNLAGQI